MQSSQPEQRFQTHPGFPNGKHVCKVSSQLDNLLKSYKNLTLELQYGYGLQPYIPTPLNSDTPIFRQIHIRSNTSFVPTPLCSDNLIVDEYRNCRNIGVSEHRGVGI